jgi:hypothetical protein
LAPEPGLGARLHAGSMSATADRSPAGAPFFVGSSATAASTFPTSNARCGASTSHPPTPARRTSICSCYPVRGERRTARRQRHGRRHPPGGDRCRSERCARSRAERLHLPRRARLEKRVTSEFDLAQEDFGRALYAPNYGPDLTPPRPSLVSAAAAIGFAHPGTSSGGHIVVMRPAVM